MGRAPPSDATEQIGKRALLDALERITSAFDDGSIEADDFYFKFATANFKTQSGRCNKSSRKPASYEVALKSEIIYTVKRVFEDVENGDLEEEGYYFELATPYFSFTSGEYPPQEKDGCSLSEGEHESLSCSLWNHLSKVKDVCNKIPSVIKELSDICWKNLTVSLKGVSGHLNGSCLSFTFVFTVVACVMVVQTDASPIHAPEHPLTLTAGKDGTIPFKCSNDHQSNMPKYYTVTIEGKHRPFYLDGSLDPEGLMSPDQAERFHVEYIENENEMSIEIHIVSVSLKDQGTYIVMVIIPGEIPEPRLMKQVVIIYIPPAPAICFLELSESTITPYEVHCHTKPGNGNSTLACFQNNVKIPYRIEGDNDNQLVNKRVFWLKDPSSPVSCCAHDLKEIATIYEALCNQFQWSPVHINPDQTEKLSTKKVLTTRPSSSDSEMQLPPVQTTVHSGCAQNWSKAILPLVTTMSAFAAMPYIVI